jgi:type III restriction enzyme
VEHPKFKDFYESYLKAQGHVVGSGDSSKQNAAGDLVAVDADTTRMAKYDLCWAAQLYDQTPIPNLHEINVDMLGHYKVQFRLAQQFAPKTMITDVHVETDTKAKTWQLENDYFDYCHFLQKVARSITQTKKLNHLTSLSAEIMALADEYISRRLFTQAIDFALPEHYCVLQQQAVEDFIVEQLRSAIIKATGDLQYQPGATWCKLSDVARLMMRQKNMVATARCIYPYQAVQSSSGGFERRAINKLFNPSPEVLAFCKLDRKHDLRIEWRDDRGISRKYEPDFVVKTAERMYLLETKGNHLIDNRDTMLKAQAAVAWCKSASSVEPPLRVQVSQTVSAGASGSAVPQNVVSIRESAMDQLKAAEPGGAYLLATSRWLQQNQSKLPGAEGESCQPQGWEYLILKQSVFETNEGASFMALLPLMQMERETLVAGLQDELGLQI